MFGLMVGVRTHCLLGASELAGSVDAGREGWGI